MQITSKQRRALRGQAHGLAPLVHIGKAGLSEAVKTQAATALDQHELVKVRFSAEREERGRMAERLAAATDAILVTTIGRVAVLYRQHSNPERRKIELPS